MKTIWRIMLAGLVVALPCGPAAWAGSGSADSTAITVDTRDADGDGMPDGWETTNGLSPDSAVGNDGPAGDPDGDGQSNWNELLAGTAANDSNSALKITAVVRNVAGAFVVTWPSVPGKTYQVLYADAPGGSWSGDWPQVTAGTGETTLSYKDVTVGTATKRFYRVKLVQ